MIKHALFVLISLTMFFNCSQSNISIGERPTEITLESLEEQLERIANSDLPDFAPELYESVLEKASELRRMLEKEGRIPEEALLDAHREMIKFNTVATKSQEILGEAYKSRNATLQLNFIRALEPALAYRAQQNYETALQLANRQEFSEARKLASQVTKQYKSLISSANKKLKNMTEGTLKNYRRAIDTDLGTINTISEDINQLEAADYVYERVNLNELGLGSNGGNGGVYVPPQRGPKPPVVVFIADRGIDSVKIFWDDLSDNEIGNRILRSVDGSGWVELVDVGPIPKFEQHTYIDYSLQPDTRYCYKIQTYNQDGQRESQFRCTYTRDGNDIPIWRLQLRIKVANNSNEKAGPLVAIVGDTGEEIGVMTVMDYSHDDFNPGSEFTYDLNLGHIRELSDITNLTLSHGWWAGNSANIEEFSLLANADESWPTGVNQQREIFKLSFDNPVDIGAYYVVHADLRNNPSWLSFVTASLNSSSFNLPPVESIAGQWQIKIPKEQIVSRIESYVGHLLSVDRRVKDRLKWGDIQGPAVEVRQKEPQTLSVNLDLSAYGLEESGQNLFWAEADVDFDIVISKTCRYVNEEQILTVRLNFENFTTDVDVPLWRDLLSGGVLTVLADIIEWYIKECETPPQINQSFEIDLSRMPGINCDDLSVTFDPEANLIICCSQSLGSEEAVLEQDNRLR